MTCSIDITRLCCIVAAALALAAPANAEGNRLLPFWGQPYPYGYASVGPATLPDAATLCRDGRRDPARHAHRHRRAEACEVVLHARD